ncbi:MAG: galactokinase, partial [Bacteroidales bacterium]|nr:galactokinase [Bacteroidales bacterium]
MKETEVRAAFEKYFSGIYRLFAAPGRINIIGEHTDYNDGFVLPAAIDKRIYLAISAIEGSKAIIHSVDFDESVEFDLHSENRDLPHWALYPYGVVRELQKSGKNPGAFQAAFGGDIPEGAGLSSSAALESAFAMALNTLFDFGLNKMALAKIAQMAEHNYAGVRCGIMDQFASMHGKENHVMKLDCRSLDFEYFPLQLADYELILIDTKVKHSLASSEYNVRREQCEEGVRVLSTKLPEVKNLRDVSAKQVFNYRTLLREDVYLRCLYVTEENERVVKACDALVNGHLDHL